MVFATCLRHLIRWHQSEDVPRFPNKTYGHNTSTRQLRKLRLFDLAYYPDPERMGIPFRLQHCICQLLQRAEPFQTCAKPDMRESKQGSHHRTEHVTNHDMEIIGANKCTDALSSGMPPGSQPIWWGHSVDRRDDLLAQAVQEFACRRELTRSAKRDLELLTPSQAVDIIQALEAEKRGHALQPVEWSKIVSSRCSAKFTAGEMDEGLVAQIDSFTQVSG